MGGVGSKDWENSRKGDWARWMGQVTAPATKPVEATERDFKENVLDKMPKAGTPAPDAFDGKLQQARTNYALRLQQGKNRSSSFATGKLGGFDISKPVLGGY